MYKLAKELSRIADDVSGVEVYYNHFADVADLKAKIDAVKRFLKDVVEPISDEGLSVEGDLDFLRELGDKTFGEDIEEDIRDYVGDDVAKNKCVSMLDKIKSNLSELIKFKNIFSDRNITNAFAREGYGIVYDFDDEYEEYVSNGYKKSTIDVDSYNDRIDSFLDEVSSFYVYAKDYVFDSVYAPAYVMGRDMRTLERYFEELGVPKYTHPRMYLRSLSQEGNILLGPVRKIMDNYISKFPENVRKISNI